MSEAANTILVIDGDPDMRVLVDARFELDGYLVTVAETGKAGLNASIHVRPHLIILDPALPDMNGLEVLNLVRSWSDVPVIVLSSETDEKWKVRLLRAGADDYVTKPFGVDELAARCDAVLRRRRNVLDKDPVVQTGSLSIDLLSRTVTLNGQYVTLTRKEFRLLHILAVHVGLVISHRQLIDEIWGTSASNNLQYLRTLMRKLRQKLEFDPGEPNLLVSESGIGYRLNRDAVPSPQGAVAAVPGRAFPSPHGWNIGSNDAENVVIAQSSERRRP
jgi:two-component system KDP operon response regulator KdpE